MDKFKQKGEVGLFDLMSVVIPTGTLSAAISLPYKDNGITVAFIVAILSAIIITVGTLYLKILIRDKLDKKLSSLSETTQIRAFVSFELVTLFVLCMVSFYSFKVIYFGISNASI